MNKTLTRKLIYIVAALTLLAMLIPAMAVPASAADSDPKVTLTLVDPVTGSTTTLDGDGTYGYNIKGSTVLATAVNFAPGAWSLLNMTPGAEAQFIGPVAPPAPVMVTGVYGEALIRGTILSSNLTYAADKKWGEINRTEISAPGSNYVIWSEQLKTFSANTTITDTVYGNFITEGGAKVNVMQGAILNWYLVAGNAVVDRAAAEAPGLKTKMANLAKPTHVTMTSKDSAYQPYFNGYIGRTVTGADGKSSVILYATGEEAVKVVVVPEYPNNPQMKVTPEVTSWYFYTTEYEVVPQVRWAGEKIVLEKYFGPTYNGKYVKFFLSAPTVGALEGISTNETSDNGSVWTQVKAGFASAILYSSEPGVATVGAGLYELRDGTALGNQHIFTVYYLKFESVVIGDVVGKRAAHNDGLWNPVNPIWNAALDATTQTLNVSQDALVRARIKGYFLPFSNQSWRPEQAVLADSSTYVAVGTPGSIRLPAGRVILPDDWAWAATLFVNPTDFSGRIHWDIMNTVGGNALPTGGTEFVGAAAVYGPNPLYNPTTNPTVVKKIEVDSGWLGDYYKYLTLNNVTDYKFKPSPPAAAYTPYDAVAKRDVIGPYSPGLEEMTPAGWIVNQPAWDSQRPIHTVVPDGYLDMWDAPMPPAKVTFQILKKTAVTANAGFFKPVSKTDIYYVWAANALWTSHTDDPNNAYDQFIKVYTNPFYSEYIPAHEAIPAFANNIAYDWNSFDTSYGTYMFWAFINQNRYLPLVTSADPSGHPTYVQVYSDNHGEAMVWLNGDWNLNLKAFADIKGSADVEYKAPVGTTSVQAIVDYPYARVHQPLQSNTDVKTWLWGGLILGTDAHKWGNKVTSPYSTRMVLSAGGYDSTQMIGSYPYQSAPSHNKMVWVWITDRDGLYNGVLGAKVGWSIAPSSTGAQKISEWTTAGPGYGMSQYNEVTKNIQLVNGFLADTYGVIVGDAGTRANAYSYVKKPTVDEKKLFNKFWGSGYTYNGTYTPATAPILDEEGKALNPDDFLVAAIDLEDNTGTTTYGNCNVTITIYSTDFDPYWTNGSTLSSSVVYSTNVYFGDKDPLDDAIRPGDANCDGVVNMGDVTAVERMILGYSGVTTNAILNNEGTVDMGTVVKIERTILGLK